MTPRRVRRIASAVVVVAAAVAACTEGGTAPTTAVPSSSVPTTTASPATPSTSTATTAPSTTSTSTTPVPPPPPDEVVIGTDTEPTSLNPYAPGGGDTITLDIARAIHAGLTEIDGRSLAVVPDLAVEIPSVDNGGVVVADDGTTTVTFRIREEAVWADGTPITGDDVVFTYEAITSMPGRSDLADQYGPIVGIAADGKAATLTFAAPTLTFETMFPVLIPAHQVRGTDPVGDWNDWPWLSAGPFLFESWTPGESITLVRNDAYWKTGPDGHPLPRLDRVVFRFVSETDRLVDAFAAREIDVFAPPAWSPTLDRLRSLEGVAVTVRESPIWEHWAFQFGEHNRNRDSLNEHLGFRRAVAHALDRQAVLDLGFWESTRGLDAILDLSGLATEHPWAQYDHDSARAAALITALCEELGRDCDTDPPVVVFSTTSNAEERPAIAELAVGMLAEAGIEVRLELEDSQLFFGPTLEAGTWDLAQWAWVAHPEPALILNLFANYDPEGPIEGDPNLGWQTYTGRNYSRWGTPAVSGWPTAEFAAEPGVTITLDLNQGPSTVRDEHTARYTEILGRMRSTADRSEFAALAAEAEGILADQVVIIPLVARGSAGAVWADEIAGYEHSPWSLTWNIEEWRRVDR